MADVGTSTRLRRDRVPRGRRLRQWLGIFAGIVAVVGLISGIVWNRLVYLPSYAIGNDYRATIGEPALAQIASTDVVYSAVGLVAGLALGGVAWWFFRRRDGWVTLIAGGGAAIAGLMCLGVGEFIGPRQFTDRVAGADPGDLVRVDFASHTWVPLALWVGAAMIPLLIGALARREKWISLDPDPTSGTAQDTL